MTTGRLFNIQRFCTQDGPGIRTTVFLKGCPLRCIWCSNPESQEMESEYAIEGPLCQGCGTCERICPYHAIIKGENGKRIIDKKRCQACGLCLAACPRQAIRQFGYTAEVGEVLAEVLLDKMYYKRTGGGLTISGGEPALQWDFTRELLKRAKAESVDTLIETAGCVSWESLWAAAEYADVVYFDLKLATSTLHERFAGMGNQLILRNLSLLSEQKEHLIVRIPLIPGLNDSKNEISRIAEIIQSLPHAERIGLLPYHNYGEAKYTLLGRPYELNNLSPPDRKQLDAASRILKDITGKEVLIGI